MWLFLRKRLLMWLILAVGVPLLDWLLGKASDTIRARKGDNAVTRGLDTTRTGVRKVRGRRR
ncbi:hypothetical protein OG394_39115 [Kribbella sp. NBC_01245]|uniref:hypothetical protein n=1 Tax=Kribbella sp. NBC_01245 TaxID=2903578 RepID=UPI002E282654|nr:hypothetical protein [Kribbella sp. NBC_01245]